MIQNIKMINNNPSTQEHKKNIKDFLTGTAELIFDNQEKITNGEYVELNRMIAEITIVNNRQDESDDESEDEWEEESRRDFVNRQFHRVAALNFKIHELERGRDALLRNREFNFKKINKLHEEKRQLSKIITRNNKTIYSMFLCQVVVYIIMYISKY